MELFQIQNFYYQNITMEPELALWFKNKNSNL